jgi:soluble lytic murein transglycosylase-like protein
MTILGILLTAITVKADIDKEAFLNAIKLVESGGSDLAIGRNGERGSFQFSKNTWKMHSKQNHKCAHDPKHSLIVAFYHLEWLISRVGDDPIKLAIAWNGGSGAVSKPTKRQKEYARRVQNLYETSL